VRRIHLIKSLMDEGMTLEDIRGSFIYFRGQLDGVERALDELFAALDKSVGERNDTRPQRRRELERLLTEGRRDVDQFIKNMERTVSAVTARDDAGKG
jgi:DNA-binding transcriptional MerR regulator